MYLFESALCIHIRFSYTFFAVFPSVILLLVLGKKYFFTSCKKTKPRSKMFQIAS